MSQHITPARTYYLVFIALNVLLIATVVAAYLPMGDAHFAIAMIFATTKAVLIVLFFMHVLHSHRLTMIVAVAGFLWLGIMLALTLSDYLSRNALHILGK